MMSRTSVRNLAIAAVAFLSLAALSAASARSDAGEGGTVTVEVWLEDVSNYYGLEMRLYFDTSRLRVGAGKVTPLWEVFDEDNHFTIKNQADNSAGVIQYALTNMNPAEPFTGTGRVCSITFTGMSSGAAVLDFFYVKGSTRDGDELYPAPMDGSVVVGSMYRSHLPVVVLQ
jgi:hypothetical protein